MQRNVKCERIYVKCERNILMQRNVSSEQCL